jgi:glycosyltransferase involved in cell wall biosynthesis
MRLLIITQKVDKDDPILGFFHRWIIEFAKHAEHIHVICLEEGKHSLPSHVEVHSLGKEKKQPRIQYLVRFYRYIWKYRNEFSHVFVHMNQMYVLLGGILWRLLGKRTALWYAHGSVSLSLRVAEKIVHRIFSSSQKGFRMESNKLAIVGQGIDVEHFSYMPKSRGGRVVLLSVGRLSPTKHTDRIIEAAHQIRNYVPVDLRIVGDVALEDHRGHKEDLLNQIDGLGMRDSVHLVGAVPYERIPEQYQGADIYINVSTTGSMDKTVLEAMACGCIPIVSNEAYREMLTPYGLFFDGTVKDMVRAIRFVVDLSMERKRALSRELCDLIVKEHGLQSLITKLVVRTQEL